MTNTTLSPRQSTSRWSTVWAIVAIVAALLVAGAALLSLGGATNPPPYTGLIEKVSPGGQLLELTINEGGSTPCIGVRDLDTGAADSVCGTLDLAADLSVNGEGFLVARTKARIDRGPDSLGDCVRTAEAILPDGSFGYWCMRGGQ